jgi:hypothetical protein
MGVAIVRGYSYSPNPTRDLQNALPVFIKAAAILCCND